VANTQVAISDLDSMSPRPAGAKPPIPMIESLTVRAVMEPSAPPASTPRTNAVNEPLSTNGDDGDSIVERFLQYLEDQTQSDPGFESQWRLLWSQVALNQPLSSPEVSADIPEDTRAIMARLICVTEEIRRLARLPDQPRDGALAAAAALHEAIAETAELSVATVALCRRVNTYGVFEPMAAEEFVAGRPVQTIVYTELEHFRSHQVEGGKYRTQLGTELELFTAEGRSVWKHQEPEIVDECQKRRSDFFIAQRVSLPPTLSAGDYILKVRVEDKLSGSLSEASHPLTLRSAFSAGRVP